MGNRGKMVKGVEGRTREYRSVVYPRRSASDSGSPSDGWYLEFACSSHNFASDCSERVAFCAEVQHAQIGRSGVRSSPPGRGSRPLNDSASAGESQRQRVHRLASLGGLVALAGLEGTPPDLLLGVLLQIADRLPQLPGERREEIAHQGAARLRERGAEKRAWTHYESAAQLDRLELPREAMTELFRRLGLRLPEDQSAWTRALREALAR